LGPYHGIIEEILNADEAAPPMTREQALSLVIQRPPAHRAEELMKTLPSRTSWHDLNELSEIDPTLAAEKWEDMIDAATDKLASGAWAAR
jgi:hypothetical protein